MIMMHDFRKIMCFGWAYRGFALLNIIFNILYALFSALSFVSLIPMLNVLFNATEPITLKPDYNGIESLESFLKGNMNYYLCLLYTSDAADE